MKLFTWKVAKDNQHDISKVEHPENHLYYKLSGIYYPQPGTEIEVVHTVYQIQVTEAAFDKFVEDEENSLANKLDSLEGVSEVDYNTYKSDGYKYESLGNYIFVTINSKHDTPELKMKIFEIIKEHIK